MERMSVRQRSTYGQPLPAVSVGSFLIRQMTSRGAMTHEAFAPMTAARCGVACGPQISSLRMIVTFVSMTDAQMMPGTRIQLRPRMNA